MKIALLVYFTLITVLGMVLTQDPKLESMQRGEEIYNDFCVNCHMQNGEGVAYTFPPLAQSDFLMNNVEESIGAIKYGLQGEITVNGATYNSAMASQGLEDEEIADVMNFISNSWGNTSKNMISTDQVESVSN